MSRYPAEYHAAKTFMHTLQDHGLHPAVARVYTRLAVAMRRDAVVEGDANRAEFALSATRAAYIAALENVADMIAEAEFFGGSPCLN